MTDATPRLVTIDASILTLRRLPKKTRRPAHGGAPRPENLRAGWRKTAKYTAEEEFFILTHLTAWPRATIARHLGRTERQIRDWCWRRGQHPRNQDLLTSGEAANVSGRSQQWLTELARSGRIRARREPGGRWWLFDPCGLPGAKEVRR
jgi:hypothetical protein